MILARTVPGAVTRDVDHGTSRLWIVLGSKALDFALFLVLARGLGVESFGRHTLALSIALLFAAVADLGVCAAFARASSHTPEDVPRLLRAALRLKTQLGFVVLLMSAGISWAMGASGSVIALVSLFTLGMLVNSAAVLFDIVLRHDRRSGWTRLTDLAQSLIAISAGTFLLGLGAGVLTGALAYLCGAIVHLLTAASGSQRYWRSCPQEVVGAKPVRFHVGAEMMTSGFAFLRESAPLALSGVFLAFHFRADSVLLGAHGATSVGLYGAAYGMFEILALVSVAYRSLGFPLMARKADGPDEALRVLCRKSFRIHLLLTLGVAAFFTVQAPRIVVLLLGPSFAPAAPALALLVWALPASFLSDTLFRLLIAQRRQGLAAWAVAGACALNVLLNVLMIPRGSIVGAAQAMVASQLLCFGLLFAAFRLTVPGASLARAIRAPVLAGLLASLAMSALAPVSPDGLEGMMMSGCIGGLLYFGTLATLGALRREEAETAPHLLGLAADAEAA